MSDTIRIVIADDHVLVLDGMRQALGALPDISVVGIATSGRDLLSVLKQVTPDVLLVDIEMPQGSGLDVLRSLDEPPPTLVVTMHADPDHKRQARSAGALGFLSKSSSLRDLAAAIRAINERVDLFDEPDLATALEPYGEARLSPDAESLTPRERELLSLLANGMSKTEDLADELYISQKTVKNHLANIYMKLHVSDRAQAAVEAIRLGLGEP
jgi:DNA-binding NarL/FixJ family response regulator